MVKLLSRYLFKKHRRWFEDYLLEDMIGYIPPSVNEPGAEFLANSGDKLTKWLLWQSHIIQKKQVSEPHNAEIFRGMLLQIKILLIAASNHSRPKPKREDVTIKKPTEFDLQDFLTNAKNKSSQTKGR